MRIGIDARVLFGPHTGDRTYLLNLVRQWAQMGLEHEFLLITDRTEPLPFQLPPNFRWVRLPRLSRWLYTGLLLPHVCSVMKTNLLHVQYIAPLLAPCPVITTVHDVHWKRFPAVFPVKDRWLMDSFLPLTFRRVALVLTDSRASQEDLCQFFGLTPTKVRVIPLAAEERFFVPLSSAERQAVLQSYGLTEGYLLFVGVLQPRKNLLRVLSAFERVWHLVPNCPLVIVGKLGWQTKTLMRYLQEQGLKEQVRLIGYVPDEHLPALYQGAIAFVYPALWEGFGLPVLEAMASGTPVLTANTSSLREIGEGAAVLVDPLSVENIAEGLQRLLTDAALRADLRQKGLLRAKQFSWRQTAEATLQVYEEVGAGKR